MQSISICGDFKITGNGVSKLDNNPVPKTADLLAELGGGKYFITLDMTRAYQHLQLDESSKQHTTTNTHQVLCRYNRLPHGVTSAPEIFQRTMENVLPGISNLHVSVDGTLLTGKSCDERLIFANSARCKCCFSGSSENVFVMLSAYDDL